MERAIDVWLFVAGFAFVIATTCGETVETPSVQCRGQSFDNIRDRFHVLPCGKSRCKLVQGTDITVIFKFKPTFEVTSLVNEVSAAIGDISLPFIGVDGAQACGGNITVAATGAPTDCPLAPDQEYIYTIIIPVLEIYPTVALKVHWGLKSGNKYGMCAEVPAIIKPPSAKKARKS